MHEEIIPSQVEIDPQKFVQRVLDMKAAGYEIVEGDESSILLDLDSQTQQDHFWDWTPHLNALLQGASIEQWDSRNGNLHVRIHLEVPIPDSSKRVALAAALGSDPNRALLCLLNLQAGREFPDVLFKPTKASKEWEKKVKEDSEVAADRLLEIEEDIPF